MSDEVKSSAQETPTAPAAASAAATPTPVAKTPDATPAAESKPDAKSAADTKQVSDGKPETKAAEKPPVVPEKYDLKLPDGSSLSAEHIEKIASEAKEKGLTNEQAQALLERDHLAKASFEQAQKQAFDAKRTEWLDLAKADKEIGGEDFSKNAELAKRVIDRFAPDSLKGFLNETGFGNNPDLVRTFVRIGKLMAEDKLVVPTSGQTRGSKKDPADILYGSKK